MSDLVDRKGLRLDEHSRRIEGVLLEEEADAVVRCEEVLVADMGFAGRRRVAARGEFCHGMSVEREVCMTSALVIVSEPEEGQREQTFEKFVGFPQQLVHRLW